MFWPFLMSRLDFGPGALIVVVPIRSYMQLISVFKRREEDTLICRAIVKKACSTFVAFLADVSRNGMPRPSANSYHQYFSPLKCVGRNLCVGIFDDFFIPNADFVPH